MLADPSASQAIKLDPVSLVLHASGPVFVVVWSLTAAAFVVWVITALKLLQMKRLSAAERRFEAEAVQATSADQLYALSRRHRDAPGARVVLEIARRAGGQKVILATAKRAM